MSDLLSRQDLSFLLYDWLDVVGLTERDRYAEHSRETFEAAVDLSAQVAQEQFAPHNSLVDAQEPTFDGERVHIVDEVRQALDAYASTGLLGASMDLEHGGMQFPYVVSAACAAWFQAASVGISGYPFLTQANANLLLAHASDELVGRWVAPMLEGRCFGTMCLSEPQAGSSLADVATRAEPQPDGSYRVFGTKMWISGGEHDLSENIVHLVLARTPDGPAGVKGLSLFLVPKVLPDDSTGPAGRNDVVLVGLNHKMGYRGTVNTVLNFGEGVHTPGGAPGAVGYLVGERHQGLAAMFHMMNEARIGVGAGATALGYTGYLTSLRYARERTQGRRLASRDPGSAPVPIIEHVDVRRMLLAQKSYVEGAMGLVLYCARLVDEQKSAPDPAARERAGLLLDVLTPVAKSWPSQWCLQANDLAIQVLGGYGYTRDYGVEQHYRDNRLNPIHEGTHGIQALDLLGRKVVMRSGAGLATLAETVAGTVARADDAGGQVAALGAPLGSALARVVDVTRAVWSADDAELSLAHATAYLEAVGHVVVAWVWLEQRLAIGDRRDDFAAGKRQAAQYFFRYELPKVYQQLDLVQSLDRTTLDMRDAWF